MRHRTVVPRGRLGWPLLLSTALATVLATQAFAATGVTIEGVTVYCDDTSVPCVGQAK